MDIKKLPHDVQESLRSGLNINSPRQCVTELILNSLDAKSTAIAVRVNLLTFRLQVVDNGLGISKSNLNFLGLRYMTSKCHSRSDLEANSKYYGFRGEALANIASVSKKVQIISRAKDMENTYTKTLQDKKNSEVTEMKQRPEFGTTVTVEGFLYNLPVRQKRIKPDFDLEVIKKVVESFAIVYPNVTFSLRDDSTKKMVVSLPTMDSVLDRVREFYPELDYEQLSEICVSEKNRLVGLKGLIYKSAHSNANMQFIYINKRPVGVSKIRCLINRLFAKKFKSGVHKNVYAAYVINIKCPYADLDLILHPSKTTVVFKHIERIASCVEKGFSEIWGIVQKVEVATRHNEAFKVEGKKFGSSQIFGAVKSVAVKRAKDVQRDTEEVVMSSDEASGKNLIMEMFLKSTQIYAKSVDDDVLSKTITSNYFLRKVEKNQTTTFSLNITQKTVKSKCVELEDSYDLDDELNFVTQQNTLRNYNLRCINDKHMSSKGIQTSFDNFDVSKYFQSVKDFRVFKIPTRPPKKFRANPKQLQVPALKHNENIASTFSDKATYYSHHYKRKPEGKTHRAHLFLKNKESPENKHNERSKKQLPKCLKPGKLFNFKTQHKQYETPNLNNKSLNMMTEEMDAHMSGMDERPLENVSKPNKMKIPKSKTSVSKPSYSRCTAWHNHLDRIGTISCETPQNQITFPTQTIESNLDFSKIIPSSMNIFSPPLVVSLSDTQKLNLITEDLNKEKLYAGNNKTCSGTTGTRDIPLKTTDNQIVHSEWLKHSSHFGNTYYVNKRTGMATFCSPKEVANFEMKGRQDFVPKGQSPILEERGAVEERMSPASKKSLEAAILSCYKDELCTVKWEVLLENGADPKNFFDDIYKRRTKRFEDFIPHANDIPKSLGLTIHDMQTFRKEMLSDMQVIGQVDRKFVCAVIKSADLLVLFDQHAVDERIRLERLTSECTEVDEEGNLTYKSSNLEERLKIFLNSGDVDVIREYRHVFKRLGVEFDLYEDGVEIFKIPDCLGTKNVQRKDLNTIWTLTNGLIFEILDMLKKTRGSLPTTPKIINAMISTSACRGAVKFGDKLEHEKCELLVGSLANCQLPFQCAHGRPTMAPILNLQKGLPLVQTVVLKPKLRNLLKLRV